MCLHELFTVWCSLSGLVLPDCIWLAMVIIPEHSVTFLKFFSFIPNEVIVKEISKKKTFVFTFVIHFQDRMKKDSQLSITCLGIS